MRERISHFFESLLDVLKKLSKRFLIEDIAPYGNRERAVVYSISTVLALVLWLFVNLNREYLLEVDVMVNVQSLPEDLALVEAIPEKTQVKVRGEGWQLFSLYNNPAKLDLVLENDNELDFQFLLSSEIKQYAALTVTEVIPAKYKPELGIKTTKMVPVIADIELTYEQQFYPIKALDVSPDSILVTGASSLLDDIDFVRTIPTTLRNINKDLKLRVGLAIPPLLEVNETIVALTLDVEEFTEAEIEVNVDILNKPLGTVLSLTPSTISIRYDVPIKDFKKLQGIVPFAARVDYNDLDTDASGYILPTVTKFPGNATIVYKDHQPKRLRYFVNRNN
jgi:hypothetical protein